MDYKIFCHKGKPKLVQVGLHGGNGDDERQYFDASWNHIARGQEDTKSALESPALLSEMLIAAGQLSAPFDLIRVDFLLVDANCYVGELTNCHWNANDSSWGRQFEEKLSRVIFSD